MAKRVRKPPGPADHQDPRALEYFFQDLYDQHAFVGEQTVDLPSLGAGAQTAFTILVNGARPGKQQTVEYGLPPTWNQSLQVSAVFVSAENTVTFVVRNPTGGSIDMGSATYSVRVRP